MTTSYYPMNFDALAIGSTVPAATVSQILGMPAGTQRYKLKLLSLVESIRRQRPDLDTYVRTQGDAILIMTDAQASLHQQSRFRSAARQLATSHRRSMGVDTDKLDEDAKSDHDRSVYVNGRIISSIKDTRKQLRLEAKRGSLPNPVK